MTTPKTDVPNIVGRAMLVNLSLSAWTARKKDREVTKRTNAEHRADADAGNYWKKLFGNKAPELTELMSAYGRLRAAHNAQTLPWTEDGWRILPTENYFAYMEEIRARRAAFEAALESFLAAYDRLVRGAKDRLGDMYRESDYPPAYEVRGKYGVRLERMPIPVGSDFRVALPDAELERMAREVEEHVAGAVRDAMADAWARLGDAVAHLRDRCEDGKYLSERHDFVEKLREIAEVLGRLNITKDAELERVRARVLKELAPFSITQLHADEAARAAAASTADDILKQMKAHYTPTEEDA